MSTRVRERAAYSSNGDEHRAIHALFEIYFLESYPLTFVCQGGGEYIMYGFNPRIVCVPRLLTDTGLFRRVPMPG